MRSDGEAGPDRDPGGRAARRAEGAGRLARGVVVGIGAGLLFGLLEALYVVLTRPLAFDERGEAVRFALIEVGLLSGAGAIAGLAGGALALLVGAASGRARSPAAVERWATRLYVLLAAPPLVACVLLAFAGRRMRALPARPLLMALAALVAIALALAAVALARALLRRLSAGTLPAARAVAPLVFLLAVATHVANARVLPRLYLFFHLALAAATALLLAGAVFAFMLHRTRGTPPRRAAIALVVVALLAGRWSLRQLSFWPALRAVAFDDTLAESPLLGAASALHLAPRAVVPPPHLSPLPPPSQAPLPAGPRIADADFFLITVDAMRGDRLSPRTAPNLAALSETGVTFDHAYSAVPHTSFSLTSLLTGKFAWSLAALGQPLAGSESLADLFKRERYKTAAFFPPSVFFIDHERFADVEKSAWDFEYVKYEFMPAPGRTDQVIDFLDGEKPDRVFAWVHYFDPHEPYDPHPELGVVSGTALERYDGEVRFTDREIGRLVEHVRRTRRRAVIAFTADHGEEFGEHGGRYHGTTLYEDQLRVPLFFTVVGTEVAEGPRLPPRHVAAPVSLVDLAPTLLGLADVLPPARMRGHDLGPWLSAAGAPDARMPPAFAEVNAKKLLALGDERLICDVSRDFCELYDLAADPGETHSLAGREPDEVAALHARLEAWMTGQSAYERAPGIAVGGAATGRAGLPERSLSALERCRMGDLSAAPEVAALLSSRDAEVRDDAARALLRLPDAPAVREAIRAAHLASPGDLLVSALALRAGDGSLAGPLARAAESDRHEGAELDPRVRAEVALALVAMQHDEAPGAGGVGAREAVRLLGRTLPALTDEEVERRVIKSLGASRRPEALAPLLAHMDNVRTRPEVVAALGVLGDRGAVAPLSTRLADEPYVNARAEEAKTLGLLGDARAIAPLHRLLRSEEETIVRDEIAEALRRLRRAR